jgi:hypothetical protein
VLKLEDSRRIRCNSRIGHTCIKILEELSTVFNCSVLTLSVINFHREIEPYEFLTIYSK